MGCATSGGPPLDAIAPVHEAVGAWAEGRIDGPGFDIAVDRARVAFARLVGTESRYVACGTNVSAARARRVDPTSPGPLS